MAMASNFITILLLASTPQLQARQPHIVFVMTDDAGYGDVSYHGAEFETPTIDKLASEGVRLENYYVLPTCSPTRAAFMTGRYPNEFGIRTPFQNNGHGNGIPNDVPLLSEQLKHQGYSTHHVGKWHLGGSSWLFTPIGSGFDTQFSMFGAMGEYFTHDRPTGGRDTRCDPRTGRFGSWGFDLWDNQEPVGGRFEGQYSTHLFTDRAVKIVNDHNWIPDGDDANPLFIWLAYSAPHSPWQAPNDLQDAYCSHITFEPRRIYCAMVRAVDNGIQRVMDALKDKGYLDDTLIVISSDNGASVVIDTSNPAGQLPAAGSNAPLRNGKHNLFEGCCRTYGIAWGNMLDQSVRGTENTDLFHVSDWYLTLLDAAGGSPVPQFSRTAPDGEILDVSFNQWEALSTGSTGPRRDMVYNFNTNEAQVAVRNNNFKLFMGSNRMARDGWFSFNVSLPDEYVCGNPMDGVPSCPQTLPPEMFFNIKEDPQERRPIPQGDMTPDERQNYMELQSLQQQWRSIIPPQQASIIDSQYLPEYYDCHFHPFISDPRYPVVPIRRDIDGINCPEYLGPDNWRRYA